MKASMGSFQWQRPARTVMGDVYTALVGADGREIGRYWHLGSGYRPDSPRGNAKLRATEEEARAVVLKKALKCSTENVPRSSDFTPDRTAEQHEAGTHGVMGSEAAKAGWKSASGEFEASGGDSAPQVRGAGEYLLKALTPGPLASSISPAPGDAVGEEPIGTGRGALISGKTQAGELCLESLPETGPHNKGNGPASPDGAEGELTACRRPSADVPPRAPGTDANGPSAPIALSHETTKDRPCDKGGPNANVCQDKST